MEYYSNGKLMLTGEYLVLKGALSLALPLRFGQKMVVVPIADYWLQWETFVEGNLWFSVNISLPDLKVISSIDNEKAAIIAELLIAAREMNPNFLKGDQGFAVKTSIGFPLEWGIGASSSLVSNIASWADCDPFILNRIVFKGSGYDVACAKSNGPIVYKIENLNPVVDIAQFSPPFTQNLYFIWLNRKQNTREEIRGFDKNRTYKVEISAIDSITRSMVMCQHLSDFQELINQHEKVMSTVLNVKPVKERLFPDFPGAVKSLGAWGGDFVMAATMLTPVETKRYFNQKGFTTVFKYDEIVLS